MRARHGVRMAGLWVVSGKLLCDSCKCTSHRRYSTRLTLVCMAAGRGLAILAAAARCNSHALSALQHAVPFVHGSVLHLSCRGAPPAV